MMKDNADYKAGSVQAVDSTQFMSGDAEALVAKSAKLCTGLTFHGQTILLLTWHTHGSYRKRVTGGCKSMKRHARNAMGIIMKTSARTNAQFVEAATLKM